MKKKKEEFYYKNLYDCVECSYKAAIFLKKEMENYKKEKVGEKLDEMHEFEQKADSKKHKMMSVLSGAFITPIEREDLIALSNYLDDITDAVEEILLEIYMSNTDNIRKDVFPMINVLLDCIATLGDVIKELKNFKHSKVIEKYIIKVNDLEEQADKLFVNNMHNLHMESDILTIVIWRKIYECIEKCVDTCEHAADIVTTVIMKNS